MSPSVRLLVGRSVGRLVCRFVCRSFLKGREVLLLCSIGALIFLPDIILPRVHLASRAKEIAGGTGGLRKGGNQGTPISGQEHLLTGYEHHVITGQN